VDAVASVGMEWIPSSRRLRVRNGSLALAGFIAAIQLPVVWAKGTHVYGGDSAIWAVWSAIGALVIVWSATTSFVVDRIPTRSGTRNAAGERVTTWHRRKVSLLGHAVGLRERAETHSSALFAFLKTQPQFDASGVGRAPETGHADRAKQMREMMADTDARRAEWRHRYIAEYSTESLALFEAFEALGIAEAHDRFYFETANSDVDVQRIAQKLGAWAKQL
jgi:hypothetical protein